MKHYLSKNFALRGDARYILDFTGNDLHHNLLYNAGLTFEFGLDDEEPVTPAPVEPVKKRSARADLRVVQKKTGARKTAMGTVSLTVLTNVRIRRKG